MRQAVSAIMLVSALPAIIVRYYCVSLLVVRVSSETVRGVRAGVLSTGSLLHPTAGAELGTQAPNRKAQLLEPI